MICEEIKDLITIGVFGKLTPPEKARLEAHLKECSRCNEIFNSMGESMNLLNEEEKIILPDKEESWQVISAKALKKKKTWFESFTPKIPAFQFSFIFLLLLVGFAAGYFIQNGSERKGEIIQLRQEVHRMQEIAAVSLLQQESLNLMLREMSPSTLSTQSDRDPLGSLFRTFLGESESNLLPASLDDPKLLPRDSINRADFIHSLSEQTSPLAEIALILARYIEHLKLQ